MSVFRVIQDDYVINDSTIVTSGLFQDGVSNITTFFTIPEVGIFSFTFNSFTIMLIPLT